MRLDKFLAEKHTEVSRSRIQKAIKDGKVLVNNHKVIDPDFQVSEADSIIIPEFKDDLIASNLELKIVFENQDCAVIDKPAGLVVHPGAGNTKDTMANALITLYPGIEKVGEPHRPGIVHRLDEDTSGLILIAKNQKSLEYFKKLFLDRKVEKEYLALVHGIPAKKHEMIDVPLEKQPLKQKMKVGAGKEAQTEYWVCEGAGQFALLRVKLHTGRTHQIRAHLAYIKHPIVGDTVYGLKKDILDRQFLHAYKLKFQLLDGTWMELFSKLPPDLVETLRKVNITYDDSHLQ